MSDQEQPPAGPWTAEERQRILEAGAGIRDEIVTAHGAAILEIGAWHRDRIQTALAAFKAEVDRLRTEHREALEGQRAILEDALAEARRELAGILANEPPEVAHVPLDARLAVLAPGRELYQTMGLRGLTIDAGPAREGD